MKKYLIGETKDKQCKVIINLYKSPLINYSIEEIKAMSIGAWKINKNIDLYYYKTWRIPCHCRKQIKQLRRKMYNVRYRV